MHVQPYLFFEGRCEEAIKYYERTIGAKVEMMMRNKETPGGPNPDMCPPGNEDKILHAAFKIGDSLIMGSDGMCSGKPVFQGTALSIAVKETAEADRIFASLSDGGKVNMPLSETFFSPRFGMTVDRFGVHWMVIVERAS